MKYELKITLMPYKLIYSVLFMLIIIFVRPISSYSEIISVLESSVALLAGVFMADNYYKEYMNERIAVYYRFPYWEKYLSVIKRTFISMVYMVLLTAVCYWGFVFIYDPTNYSGVSIIRIYLQCIGACTTSMFFMGVFCFTVTNSARNLGVGIGILFLAWLFLTSSITDILPEVLQIFKLSGEVVQEGYLVPFWPSRILYVVVGLVMLLLNIPLVKKQPDYKKKGWRRYGNKS